MAQRVLPETFLLLGGDGPTFYLSAGNSAPTQAGDGTFKVMDVIWNTAPAAGGTAFWVCTTAGNGATATFKGVAIGA